MYNPLSNYQPLNKVLISKSALIHNFNYLKQISNSLVFPNLKSNAYGHGIVETAKIIDELNCRYIVVDSIYEASILKKNKVKTPILITGYVDPENLKFIRHSFTYAVWEQDQIERILKIKPNAKLHLFIDSGMGREGVRFTDLVNIENTIIKYKSNFEGIMSHFASADDLSSSQTEEQIYFFKKSIDYFASVGVNFEYIHISASAGILSTEIEFCNACRTGISLYGIDPLNSSTDLKPALTLTTKLAQIKSINKGSPVGYNATYTAKQDTKIGILPIGYNDGVDRALSNKGYVKLNNNFCKIIGKVSMNITTIDLTNIDANLNDAVTIYSNNISDKNSIENASSICDKISYELLVHINSSIKRYVTD